MRLFVRAAYGRLGRVRKPCHNTKPFDTSYYDLFLLNENMRVAIVSFSPETVLKTRGEMPS